MHPAVLVVAAALIVALALLGVALPRRGERPGSLPLAKRRRTACPVCGSLQGEGESVRTVAYPGAVERLVYLYGCGHCYGAAAHVVRRCPVCRSRLEGEDYLVGRLLAGEPRGRVRVWGCSRCQRRS